MNIIEVRNSEFLNKNSGKNKLKVTVKLDNSLVYEVQFEKEKSNGELTVKSFIPTHIEDVEIENFIDMISAATNHRVSQDDRDRLGKEILKHPKVRLKKLQLS